MKSTVIACQCKDLSVRLNSSSGGVFPLLARKVLQNNGIVYGAAFDKDFNVRHISIIDEESIPLLTGSKYAYSNLGYTFKEIKKQLDEGVCVLFCGTPCQAFALKKYIGREYTNLLLVDFICHGTPTNEMWRKYLDERRAGRVVKNVNFRDKSNGWKDYRIVIKYEDGSEYIKDHGKDTYIKGFAHNYILRNACYSCEFKGVDERISDITLGDLWGAEYLCPKLYDDKGTSLLMIHSEKGQALFESILDQVEVSKVDIEKALDINWVALKHVEKNLNADRFYEEYKKSNELINTLDKYVNPNIFKRIVQRMLKNFSHRQKITN